MVVAAVAATVGVVEPPGGSLVDAVAVALSASDGVLVLDNCEHVLGAARACVERLLTSCPSLHVIITSRVRLAAPYEWVYEVPGLSVGDDGGDAVRLFLERAAATGSTTEVDPRQVSILCRSLDGMALAIELAAGRYPSLGVDGLLAGLDHRLRYLTSGARGDDRHRSLEDAIAWSYDLLGPADQALLGAVSVFASWFDVDAAAAITETSSTRPDVADALARLADHHLLVVAPGQPTRYRVLETIRQYADERLSRAGQADTVRDRHRAWCRDRLSVLAGQPHDDDWCVRFDRVADDVRAAIMWAAERGIDEPAAALAEPLAEQLLLRGQLAEAQRRYEQAARHAPPGRERVRLLRLAAGTAAARVTGNDTLRLLDEATTEALAIEDRDTAAECRAWMVIYLRMMPGIMAVVPSADEGARWLREARGYATDSPVAEAAIGVATAAGLPESDPDSTELAARALALAHDADAPLVESVALDQLCGVLARPGRPHRCDRGRPSSRPGPRHAAPRRVDGVPVQRLPADGRRDPSRRRQPDRGRPATPTGSPAWPPTASSPIWPPPGGSRWTRWPATWTGRPSRASGSWPPGSAPGGRSPGPSTSPRTRWPWCTRCSGTKSAAARGPRSPLPCPATRRGWRAVAPASPRPSTPWSPWTGMTRMRRSARLSADVDDRAVWGTWIMGLWRPWYAALWVEAAALAGHPDAADRLRRGAAATRENPIAAAIVRRSAALARGDHDTLLTFPRTFAALGCRYQERRSQTLLEGFAKR